MGRLIIGATAIVTGVAAALGMVVRRRRARRDDALPLDPAVPIGGSASAHEPAASSIQADFGPVSDPESSATGSSSTAPRKPRAPRKASTAKPPTTKRGTTGKKASAGATTATVGGDQAVAPPGRPKRPTRVRTTQAPTVAESIAPTDGDGASPADGS